MSIPGFSDCSKDMERNIYIYICSRHIKDILSIISMLLVNYRFNYSLTNLEVSKKLEV